MSQTVAITGNQFTNVLRALDVNFILDGQSKDKPLHEQPVRLLDNSEIQSHACEYDFHPSVLDHLQELKNRVKYLSGIISLMLNKKRGCYTALFVTSENRYSFPILSTAFIKSSSLGWV